MKAELVLGNLKREREALNNKLERLDEALSKEWQDVDQEYLCTQQYNAMALYAHILDERIADIECKLEEKKVEKMMGEDKDEPCCCSNKIYNEKIDFDSYKKDYNNICGEKEKDECKCEDVYTIFLDIVKGVLGEDEFDEQ